MLGDQTRYALIPDWSTSCCSAALVIEMHPALGDIDCFCGGCLTGLRVMVLHLHRLALTAEWQWQDGGAAVTVTEVPQRVHLRALVDLEDELTGEGRFVSSNMGRVDLSEAWEAGDAIAAGVYLLAMRISVVLWRILPA